MKITYLRKNIQVLISFLVFGLISSCANIGTPNGGPYDEDPPKFVSSTPKPNQTNFKGKKVEILFDELIQLDKPSENVIITPPQKQMPVIRAQGRKAVVELKDTLQENTTYTIDFTNSIGDNNEKNIYENFTFAFSTGDVIDSLEVSGYLLNAENLEPMPGITIGLHSNLDDSAFVTIPFARTSRTNDRGKFVIRNIAPGTYNIFALNDVNRDYLFDQPGEEIAFCDSLIVPDFEFTSRQDTLWKDSLTVDTIRVVHYTRFVPDNIELRLFKEAFQRQYILRPERPQENLFILRFNAPLDSMPAPIPLNFTPEDKEWYFPQWGEEEKAVNYWLVDPITWDQDTLLMEVSYLKSDSMNILRPQTDTISVAMRKRPEPKKKKKNDDEPDPIPFLNMTISTSSSIEVFDTISIVFDEPVFELYKDYFRLEQKVDTLWHSVDFELYPSPVNSLGFYIQREWKYGEEYRLEVDSATISSIYDKWNDKYTQTFRVKDLDTYGHLYINISGTDTVPAFVELLDGSDTPIRKAKVKDGGVLFMNLSPNKYYARLILDTNDNYMWDTGLYAEKIQPEVVFYCPKVYEIRENWRIEDSWDIHSATFTKQKPLEITQNKPKEETKQKRDHRNEGKIQSSSGSSSSSQMPGNIRF